jgi:hypothetical protein
MLENSASVETNLFGSCHQHTLRLALFNIMEFDDVNIRDPFEV